LTQHKTSNAATCLTFSKLDLGITFYSLHSNKIVLENAWREVAIAMGKTESGENGREKCP